MARPATPDDVDRICGELPETELGISWGDRPTWKVPRGDKGKGFLLYRMPHQTAVDPETGEMYDDLIVIQTPTAAEKQALVDDPDTPFFTIDHFRNYDAVLVQLSRLGELGVDELREIITDAWAKRAPKRLVREHLGRCRCGGGPQMTDAARLAAYDVLRAVRVDDAYANLVLPTLLREHRLSGRDAGFATELASGTLRRLGSYDAVIDACLDRGKVQPRVRDVLRLGAHQILAMRVEDHAAVSATVDLARARGGPRSAGLVNAVLRRIAAADLDTWLERVAPDAASDPVGHASVVHSHPRWVVEAFGAALGERSAELPDLLAADNAPPRVVLVARPGRSTVDELPGEPTLLSPYGVVMGGGDPGSVPAVAEGRAGVQDEGSQLVALALAAAEVEGEDRRWLDLCAGPGGKAALLAALAAGSGARLVANERQPHRAELVSRALAGAEGVEEVTVHDGTRAAVAHRVVRPGPGRRALLGPGGAPAPARGPLAAPAYRPPGAGAAAARAARRRPRPGAPRRGGALRDLLPGARRDLRRALVGPRRPATTSGSSRCRSTSPTRPRRWPGPPSCGPTDTAPTRCSWGCCDACDGSDELRVTTRSRTRCDP